MSELFRFFGAGMLFYIFGNRIPMKRNWAIIGAVSCVAAIFTPVFVEVVAIAGSYAIMYFAYNSPRVIREFTARGDISYGVYVYAFPIQQLLVPMSTGFVIGGLALPWLANFLLALPITIIAGIISWVAIEKPFLSLGKTDKLQPSAA